MQILQLYGIVCLKMAGVLPVWSSENHVWKAKEHFVPLWLLLLQFVVSKYIMVLSPSPDAVLWSDCKTKT